MNQKYPNLASIIMFGRNIIQFIEYISIDEIALLKEAKVCDESRDKSESGEDLTKSESSVIEA